MSDETVNLNGVQGRRGGGLPAEGRHHVIIREATAKPSRHKGTPGVEIRAEIVKGPDVGSALYDRMWVTPKSLPGIVWQLDCVGINPPTGDINATKLTEWIAPRLVGKAAFWTVRHEEYEQPDTREMKKRCEVRAWDPIGSAGASDMPGDGMPAASGSASDDDIPF